MVPGRGRPLTQELSEAGKSTPIMVFECRGYEPVDYVFGGGWKARSVCFYFLTMHFLLCMSIAGGIFEHFILLLHGECLLS